VFYKDPAGERNLLPSGDPQFYSDVKIAGDSGTITAELRNIENDALFTVDLPAQA